MRVLMLAQFYSPIVGGEERHVQDLSIELVNRGHDVVVATFWQQGLAEFEVDQGIRIYRIRSTLQRATWLYREKERRHAPPFPDPGALWALRNIVAHERPDIIHAHNWLHYSFLPLKLWSQAPLILTLHDYSLRCANKRLMYYDSLCDGPALVKCFNCAANHYGPGRGQFIAATNWLMRAAAAKAVDIFLPVSQAAAAGNGLVGSGLPFQIIPNFVPDHSSTSREDVDSYLAQLPQEDYLLFVGDLSRFKGVEVLLRAYANLSNAPPLVLIGRKRPQTPADCPPNVLLLDKWPHAAVLAAWRRSIIALAPSVSCEPFGIVAIEAMAAGRPLIASRIGGLTDIVVDGETGFLVPPGDPVALGQAIERLLASPALRQRLGQAAKRKVAGFQASAIVPRIERVYEFILDTVPAARKAEQLSRNDF